MKATLLVLIVSGILLVSGGTAAPAETQKKDINHATLEDLVAVKGIGDKKASAIMAYLRRHGPIENMDELLRVRGVGVKLLERLKRDFEVKERDGTP